MTYEEFLENLRATPREWYLCAPWGVNLQNRMIRCDIANAKFCPINRVIQITTWVLPRELRSKIMMAADEAGNYDPKIRRDLLEACGLAEVGQ